eukprot:g2018.t1
MSHEKVAAKERQGRVDHVMDARLYFDKILPTLLARVAGKIGVPADSTGLAMCAHSLVNALMDSCTVLCFKMREQGEEVMAAYSRLAMRDAMLSFQVNNLKPGVKMQFLDLARNLVCCQFPGSEQARIKGYMEYWRPIEKWAMEMGEELSSTTSTSASSSYGQEESGDGMVTILDKLLTDFIAEEERRYEPQQAMNDATVNIDAKKKQITGGRVGFIDPGQLAFPLYTKLQACILRAVEDNSASSSSS